LNPRFATRYATRAVSVLVFPDPGGARTCKTAAGLVTAHFCCEFNSDNNASIEAVHYHSRPVIEEGSRGGVVDARSADTAGLVFFRPSWDLPPLAFSGVSGP